MAFFFLMMGSPMAFFRSADLGKSLAWPTQQHGSMELGKCGVEDVSRSYDLFLSVRIPKPCDHVDQH